MSKKPAGRRKHFILLRQAFTYCGRWHRELEVVRQIEDVDCIKCLQLIDERNKDANNGKEHPVAGPRRRELGYN